MCVAACTQGPVMDNIQRAGYDKPTPVQKYAVPILCAGPGLKPGTVGLRTTFADIGETIAAHLGLAPGPHGRSFLGELSGDA